MHRVSGVTPKAPNASSAAAKAGCPAGLTEASCGACAATKSPQLCYSCMQGSGITWLAGSAKCVPCANGGKC